jgi:cytidylate kinase
MFMSRKPINIAIDGYSSCGKSTLAKALAKDIQFTYIDSGAMYRCVTLYLMQQNIDVDNKTAIIEALPHIHIDVNFETFILNGIDVSKDIRKMEISQRVSQVSAIKEVRQDMVRMQRQLGNKIDIVMDGRDIGTTVFPQAQLKVFMTAHPMIRAQRRFKEMLEKGEESSLEEVMANLNMRDYEDTHRTESPLSKAEDAIVLDNSFLTPDEQLAFVKQKLIDLHLLNI